MPFQIIRNDITKVKADAIVNTANPLATIGGGTDSAIYTAAGKEQLLADRKKIGEIARGDVAVTPAYNLKAKYIIHTVGPKWSGGENGEYEILRNCYRKSLEKAFELGCESIAFPLISSGVYGFPKDKALQIAMGEISDFLMRGDVEMMVKLVVFDDKAFRLSRNLFMQIESFVDDEEVLAAYAEEYGYSRGGSERGLKSSEASAVAQRESYSEHLASELVTMSSKFADILPFHKKPFDENSFDKSLYMNDGKEDLSFQNHLLKLIIEKDLDNATVYKRSNVTKGAFSKIMCGDTKVPRKKTVLGFCIGLRLSLTEAKELLASADMAFNPYNKRDRLVIQCIESGQYNIDNVNAMLYVCGQPLLGN